MHIHLITIGDKTECAMGRNGTVIPINDAKLSDLFKFREENKRWWMNSIEKILTIAGLMLLSFMLGQFYHASKIDKKTEKRISNIERIIDINGLTLAGD